MKKILTVLIGVGLLAVLVLPIKARAQETLKECCRLRKNVTIDDIIYSEGLVVTGRAMTQGECSLLPDDPFLTDPTEECLDAGGDGTIDSTDGCFSGRWGLVCLMSTISYVTDWIFTILLLIAVIMMIYGGFSMLLSMGDEAGWTRGRNILMYSVAGVAVAVVAKLIPAMVRAIMGI